LRAALLTSVSVLLLAACGGDSGEPAATAAPPTATTEVTETEETPTGETIAAIRETPLTAKLDSGYRVENGSISNPDEADLPVAPGSVEAHWYKSQSRWVVVYAGVPEDPGPICPGNSILVGTSYESVSNAPIEDGVSCGGAILAQEPAGVQWCGPYLVYVTEIPASKNGALSASIERYDGAVILGVTGVTSTDFGTAPKVELSELGC
jgi:hypothetical protein